MEYLISKLIQGFEEGKLSRRQLIKSLALTATVAASAGAAPFAMGQTPEPTSAFDNKLIKAIGVNHISIQCKDYAKDRDFYAGLLGLEVSNETGKSCNLRVGETVLVLRNAGVRLVPGPDGNLPHGTDKLGVDHISYTLDNWENVEGMLRDELKRRGLAVVTEGNEKAGTSSLTFQGLEGLDVQVGGKNQIPPAKPSA